MTIETINSAALRLFSALNQQHVIDPLVETSPDMTLTDAYNISRKILDLRLAEGEVITGKKIGITSLAVQKMLNVGQPDFGFLTDRMVFDDGATIEINRHFIQPRIEGEMAFILKKGLKGPGVTAADVLAATEAIAPCFEIVDSRIRDWNISIVDTVADNASCGAYITGDSWENLDLVDFDNIELIVTRDGETVSTGKGSDVIGNPLGSMAWLANTLGQYDIGLEAGEVILSGSFGALIDVGANSTYTAILQGVGKATVSFV